MSAQARWKYFRLTEQRILFDLERDLEEELGHTPTNAAEFGEDSSSAQALIPNGE